MTSKKSKEESIEIKCEHLHIAKLDPELNPLKDIELYVCQDCIQAFKVEPVDVDWIQQVEGEEDAVFLP